MITDGSSCGYPMRLPTASGSAWREWYGSATSQYVAAPTLASECTDRSPLAIHFSKAAKT